MPARRVACYALLLAAFIPAPAIAEKDGDAPMPVVFKADFSGDLGAWTMTDPDAWTTVQEEGDGKLALVAQSKYEPPVRSPLNIARVTDLDVTDFVFDVEAKQTGREYGHRDLCFFFGYQDPAHFYYVHLASVADDHANSIFLVNGEPRVSIAQKRTTGTDWASGYHRIRIARDTKAGTIKVYFNNMDEPVMETVDTTFLHGGIGLGSFDDTGHFDNVEIRGTLHTPAE